MKCDSYDPCDPYSVFFDPWECDDSNNKKNPPKDCAGVENGTAYLDNCGTCVGGTTGKESCTQDCTGVLGGSAYVNYCGKCIDGNQGLFDTQVLTSGELNTFNNAINTLQSSCVGSILLSNLNQHSGIAILFQSSSAGTGTFDPCKGQITINPSNTNNMLYWRAELFHLYQDQNYNGILSQMINGTRQTGGSNIEAEEKLFSLMSGIINNDYVCFPGWVAPDQWLTTFLKNHPIGTKVTDLTPQEKQDWFSAVEVYRQYWTSDPNPQLNAKPVDYDLLPNAFLQFFNKFSNCP